MAAARKLFTEKGVSGTTIEDLADEADVARATFFNYFVSKIAVVDEILNEQDAGFYRRLAVALELDIPTQALLESFFTGSAKVIENEPEFFRVMIAELEKSSSGLGTDNDRYQTMIVQFKKIVDRGVGRDEVRRDCPTDLLAEILVGAYATVLRSWRSIPGYKLAHRLQTTARLMGDFMAPHQEPSAAPSVRR